MYKPKRSDEKYWTGTNQFDEIQYANELEEYIFELEAELANLTGPLTNNEGIKMDFLTFEEKLNKYIYLKAFAKELQLKDEPEKSKQDLWNYVNSSAINKKITKR